MITPETQAFAHGFPVTLLHIAISLAMLFSAAGIYLLLTPHHEIRLIREGNVAAALDVCGVLVGALVHYVRALRNLLLPTVLLLAPISPVAWLPVAIFVFGIGDKPAIFLVFITLFFTIVLSTGAQIESVPKTYIHVARIMGATGRQTFWRVVLPAILPSLFMTLRLNLFAAWMVVLIAETVGVGTGLGQITSMARSTFNAKLVFFTMAIVGLLGFLSDFALRQVQRKMLWWVGPGGSR